MNTSPHAQAVLSLCETLAAAGYTVISANTDEQGTPQVFAQSETGALAFFFLRADGRDFTHEDADKARILAERHAVRPYWASRPAPEGSWRMTPLS